MQLLLKIGTLINHTLLKLQYFSLEQFLNLIYLIIIKVFKKKISKIISNYKFYQVSSKSYRQNLKDKKIDILTERIS